MIMDEILYLEREYRDYHRGIPSRIAMSPSQYIQLGEELGYSDIEVFHGMEITVDEHIHDIYLST